MKHLGLVIGDALRIWFWSQQFTYLERRVRHLQNLPGLNNGTAGIIIGLMGACATPPMMQLSGVGIARFDTSVQNVTLMTVISEITLRQMRSALNSSDMTYNPTLTTDMQIMKSPGPATQY